MWYKVAVTLFWAARSGCSRVQFLSFRLLINRLNEVDWSLLFNVNCKRGALPGRVSSLPRLPAGQELVAAGVGSAYILIYYIGSCGHLLYMTFHVRSAAFIRARDT